MTFDDMSLFVAVARAGNFTRAGVQMGVPNATLSRRVAALESELGLRLFDRTTRRMILTPTGQRLLERCASLVDEAAAIRTELTASSLTPSGHVRVSMPVDLGVTYLGEWLPSFVRAHPGVTLDLDLSPRYTDLSADGVDVAFRFEAVGGRGNVVRRVGSISRGLYASPGYLGRHGRPRTPEDLANHTCLKLGFALKGTGWPLEKNGKVQHVKVQGPVGLNNMGLVRILAEQDLGIGLLPHQVARTAVDAGRLERVLRDWDPPDWSVYAVTASRIIPAPARALIDFVQARLQAP